jgi:hypothetical protein
MAFPLLVTICKVASTLPTFFPLPWQLGGS